MDQYFCGRKRKYDILLETGSNEKESTSKKSKSDPFASLTDTNAVESYRNHIYFYCGVSKKTCLKLNIELKKTAQSIIDNGKNLLNKDKYIYLHINSFGGSVFAALSTIDTIMNLPVPVVSIIEGAAASAATMISVVCNYRIIYPNSYMLIHQLSSSCWGQMDDLEEEMGNLRELMDKIKSLYKKNTKINEKDLDEILKHDIWWGAEKCLESGLVDKIHESKPVYEIDEDKIDL